MNEENINKNDSISNNMFETSLETSFFYTNDKFLNNIDNKEIFKYIQTKYKNFCPDNTDTIIKKSILQLLNDDKFILNILDYYNITIYDFFKLLFAQYGTLIKGQFIKRIINEIKDKQYVKRTRYIKSSNRISKNI